MYNECVSPRPGERFGLGLNYRHLHAQAAHLEFEIFSDFLYQERQKSTFSITCSGFSAIEVRYTIFTIIISV